MSTEVDNNPAENVQAAVTHWLDQTTLAGDLEASRLLSRGLDPARHGLVGRLPLLLPCTGEESDAVLDLLWHGQVPTPAAVAALLNSPRARAAVLCRSLWRARADVPAGLIAAHTHALGEALSAGVAMHWIDHDIGPTWRRAWQCEPVANWWMSWSMDTPPFAPFGRDGLALLHRVYWLASNGNTGSLCPGRRYYTRFYGDHVSRMPADIVGSSVARFVSAYRRCHAGSGPGWEEIAAAATDPCGVQLFFNAADARAQQRWLLTDGWIRIDSGSLCRGPRSDTPRYWLSRQHVAAGLATAS